MTEFPMAVVYLVLAAALWWIRKTRVTQSGPRLILLVLALLLTYPALNAAYIALKHSL